MKSKSWRCNFDLMIDTRCTSIFQHLMVGHQQSCLGIIFEDSSPESFRKLKPGSLETWFLLIRLLVLIVFHRIFSVPWRFEWTGFLCIYILLQISHFSIFESLFVFVQKNPKRSCQSKDFQTNEIFQTHSTFNVHQISTWWGFDSAPARGYFTGRTTEKRQYFSNVSTEFTTTVLPVNSHYGCCFSGKTPITPVFLWLITASVAKFDMINIVLPECEFLEKMLSESSVKNRCFRE